MSIIGSNILAGASGQAGYNINNSLRFRASNSAYLSRTPSAGNRQIWTWSCWVKKTPLASGVQAMIAAGVSSVVYDDFCFENDQIRFVFNNGTYDVRTTQVFRDPSAWYHIVCAVDTTQATSSNRVKIYVNGSQVTAFATASYPAQNHNTNINNNILNNIGNLYNGSFSSYFDGYMTEVNFIDGQALTPSSFGETSLTTGSWIPKKYTSTYGTNGFYLKFADASAATAAAIGKDSSGNGNNWTPSGISVTAGVTYDAMLDVPTNTSATVANYAVMNPLWKDGTVVIAQGNLDVSNGNYGGFSTLTIPTNSKFYAEFTVTATQGNQGVGILKAANAYSGVLSQTDGFGANTVTYYSTNGNKFVFGSSTAYGSSWGTIGDVIGIAVNTVDNQITFYKNNTSQGVITGLTSGIEWVFTTGNQTNTGGGAWNFGQRPFSYTPPTGFVRLNTFNLPTPTILQGNKYMDATLWTGTGATATITNAGAFQPDLVWVKNRSSGVYWNVLFDSVRGAGNQLSSNQTDAELASASNVGGKVSAFNSNGFALATGSSSILSVNGTSNTYVGWQWQAGQGTTTVGTGTGGITSVTQSVSTTAGFSVVTYTGSGTNGTVTHGLGVAPSMVIVKSKTTAENWMVYHTSIGATKYIYLDSTGAAVTLSTIWNNTAPTPSVFSVGTNVTVNQSSTNYVAYCWAEIAGFSKFTSYTGNGSADGPFIYCGFRPKFVMTKRTDTSGNYWVIKDTTRNTYNTADLNLYPNASDAEATSATAYVDILSNGFKVRGTSSDHNTSAATYIVMAYAENPFKNSNAR